MRHLPALLLACAAPFAQAQDQDLPLKLTVGRYALHGGGASAVGVDTNLRHTSSLGNAWIGAYRQEQGVSTQWRAGWDQVLDVGALRVQPSVQTATGGFWGGSLYAEAGSAWYAGAGLGRTNLRPYVNLNFDPNDAITLAGGKRWQDEAGHLNSLGLTLVADNRLNPDQRHLHLTWRAVLAGQHRLTLDLLAKRGLVDGERIERVGASVTYDWPRWFLRAAWDPKVNFTQQDMLRLSAGLRL